uniref:Uncharacterized protein n=1 Tax=Tanacetum cinerariifolium TaxID=118510 RepID=A0A6L2MJZ5_TANCI|nr:hypothetical protein [Tanacetum cinerariifolium]
MIELPKSPPKKTNEEDLESEIVMVKMPRCMSWLGSTDAYDKPIGDLDMMKDKDLGLNTCTHDIPLSSREVSSFDEPESRPQPLPKCPSLDLSLGEERGSKPHIKPHNLDSFRMEMTLKKHYGFKPALLGSLTKSFLDLEEIENDLLGEGYSLPLGPKELDKEFSKGSDTTCESLGMDLLQPVKDDS